MAALSMVSARLRGYTGTVSDLLSRCEAQVAECNAAGDDEAAAFVLDASRALEEAHNRLSEAAVFTSGR